MSIFSFHPLKPIFSKIRLGGLAVCAGVVIQFAPVQARAAELELDYSGSARVGYWSDSRSLDDEKRIATAALWLKGDVDFTPLSDAFGTIKFDGWLGDQNGSSNDDDNYWLEDYGIKDDDQLRELYWQTYISEADIRIGRQLIIWGRTDGINPTDNLTPRDYTLLTPDDSDQRVGVFAVNVAYPIGNQELQLVWQPHFHGSTIALPPINQIRYQSQKPEQQQQYAIKLDHLGQQMDWSLSYVSGNNLLADFSLLSVNGQGAVIGLTHHRQQVLGADASAVLGDYVLRAEVARTWVDKPKDDPNFYFHKKPQLQMVLGAERALSGSYTLGLQVFAQQIYGYRNPAFISNPILKELALQQAAASNQTESLQKGLTYRLAWDSTDYTWHVESTGVYIANTDSHFIRAKLQHALDDHWQVILGADYYHGPKYTLLGRLEQNSTVFTELRYGF